MSEVIEARNIKLNVDASDWRDSMVKSGQLLVDSDYITKDYIDLTIKCVEENGPYIVIIPGLALSHSRPDVSVNKTGLSLITLSKPVCFDCDNDPVDIVLTLAATDDTMVESGKVSDHKEALERAGRNNSLQIYEPVEKNIEKYQELRADMNHLYQKIY